MRRSGYICLLIAAILLSSRPDAAFVPAPRHSIAATPRASSPGRSSPAPLRARVQPMRAIARHADAAPMVPMQLPAGRAATTTTLNVTPNPSGIFEPTTMTATVAVVPPAAGTPAGVVRFRANGSIIGSAPLSPSGSATFTTGLPVTGTLNLTASYVGGPEFAPSTSDVVPHEVAAATASTLTLLVTSPSPSATGAAVTAIAIVIPLSGGVPTGNVQFRDGATSIGSSALTTASGLRLAFVSFTPAGAGLHTLTAQYAGDATFATSTSAPAAHTVYAGAAPSATTTTLTSAPASSLGGNAVPGYDPITSSFRMNLGGTLDVKLRGGFVPATTDEFTILNHAERVGTFGTINGNGQSYAVCYGAATTKLGSPANGAFCGGS